MRILIAHSFYRLSGGEDRYVTQQVELLRGAGHEVELLAKRNEDLPGGFATAQRMTYSRRQTAEVSGVIERFSPDVIHVHNIYPALGPSVHLAAKKAKVPLVMTVHNFRLRCPNGYMFTEGAICTRCAKGNYLNGVLHECFPQRSQSLAYGTSLWTHRFLLRLEEMVSMFIAPSMFMQEMLTSWGIPTSKLTMIRNFTDIPADVSTEPGDYGMYLGRLSSEKGLTVLLEALAAADDPDFKIVGDGPLRAPLSELAGRLMLSRTQFLGYRTHDDVLDVLRHARFIVVPTHSFETASLSLMEAAAYGRPAIVTNLGALPELVESESEALVEPNNAIQLRDAIHAHMTRKELCRSRGLLALRFARANLTPKTHLASLEAGYGRVLALSRRPS